MLAYLCLSSYYLFSLSKFFVYHPQFLPVLIPFTKLLDISHSPFELPTLILFLLFCFLKKRLKLSSKFFTLDCSAIESTSFNQLYSSDFFSAGIIVAHLLYDNPLPVF